MRRVTYLDELPNDNRDMRAVVHLEQGIDCKQHTEPPVQVTVIVLVLGTTRGVRLINIDNLPQSTKSVQVCSTCSLIFLVITGGAALGSPRFRFTPTGSTGVGVELKEGLAAWALLLPFTCALAVDRK